MGNELQRYSSKLDITNQQIEEWKAKYNVDNDKLIEILKNFHSKKGKNNEISKENFRSICEAIGFNDEFAELLFRGKYTFECRKVGGISDSFILAADTDHSNTVDVEEYLALVGLILGGTMEQKLEFSFKIFDLDSSGN